MGKDVILEKSKSKIRQKDRQNYVQLRSTDGEDFDFPFDKNKIPNFHCKSMPSRPQENPNKPEEDSDSKRGSVYQTSDEVKQMRKIKQGRRKVDIKLGHEDGFISFDVSNPNPEPVKESEPDPEDLLERSFRDIRAMDPRNMPRPDTSRRDACLLKKSEEEEEEEEDYLEIPLLQKAGKFHNGFEMDSDSNVEKVSMLSRSFSTKMGSSSHKSHSSPFKRMFNPLKRSKSMKLPPVSPSEPSKRSGLTRKSLLSEFSKTDENVNCTVNSDGQDGVSDNMGLSPAHLRATLKIDSKNGSPNFEFAVKDPSEVISAKTWKTESKLNWVYTFHGNSTKRISTKEKPGNGIPNPVIGQMQASCYLCSEKDEKGNLHNSAVTEFVLYDIAHARIDSDSAFQERASDASTSHPWLRSELHAELETAAIVVEIPLEMEKIEMESEMERMNVVIPHGTHGKPDSEEGCPASLLERWRYGGGCDCGGWDMGCPISVFNNNFDRFGGDFAKKDRDNQPFQLFLQGGKEKVPSICIVRDREGQYLVDFHAQLSSVQAFAMCVALLHCSETEEKSKNKLYSNSLKLLLEEEVRHLIEAVSSEEKKKKKMNGNKKGEQISQQSFVVDRRPPFSPMGRV